VVLIQIEVIRAQMFERLFQFRERARFVALLCLAGEEDAPPVRLERRPQHLLGVSIARRNVEVIDTGLDGL
jgi:hypothetical protein